MLAANKAKLYTAFGLLLLVIAGAIFNSFGFFDMFKKTPSYRIVLHISDTHIDPLFDATMSMKKGVCHSCELDRSVFGKHTLCPKEFLPNNAHIKSRTKAGYSFGRYGCNPPHLLFESLRKKMLTIDPNPKIIVFTGDISPHGYPDDNFKIKDDTELDDLCDTKFLVTKHLVEDLVKSFPNARWAYTLGNNDHFPKNTYWQPYIEKYGNMLLETGFFTPEQHHQFINNGGSSYIDSDNVRYISIDYTLFVEGGEDQAAVSKRKRDDEHELYPVRHAVCRWLDGALQDAKDKGLFVYIVGHQPLTTKKGRDEFAVEDFHFLEMKRVLQAYASIIKVGLFGHRNLAGLSNVLAHDSFLPLFPSMTVPGVSPRGNNHPSFNVIYQSTEDGSVLNFEQIKFRLSDENHKALQLLDESADIDKYGSDVSGSFYLGEWDKHSGILESWKTMSGDDIFTAETLAAFQQRVVENEKLFFAMEVWKRAGYIGDESPEAYMCKALFDEEAEMMKCLFPNQDTRCWSNDWLM